MQLIKRLVPALVILLIACASFAQKMPPQNIRRVVVTSRYDIAEGKRTDKSYAIQSVFIDSLWRKHTYLHWEGNDVKNYEWHYYIGKQLNTIFTFRNKQFCLQQDFTYNADSLKSTETIYRISPGDTAKHVTLAYTYSGKYPIKVEATATNGKRAWLTTSKFDAHGTEILRKVKASKGFVPLDSIMVLTQKPTYDSLGRQASLFTTKKKVNGKLIVESYKYTYNKKGLLETLTELTPSGAVKKRTKYEYNEVNLLKFISTYDANDVLIDYLAKRYELYPTLVRTARIIEY